MDFYVYAHIRLDNNTTFYVGKGRGRRAYLKGRNKHWKSIVRKCGYTIKFIRTNLSEQDAFNLEKELIQNLKLLGQCEANYSLGGEGCSGYRWSEGQRKRHSEKQSSPSKSIIDGHKKQAKKLTGRTKETHPGIKVISLKNSGERNGRAIWNIRTPGGLFSTIKETAEHYKISTALVHKKLRLGIWKRELK